MSTDFWHSFAAAEFPPAKGRALFEGLGPSPSVAALLAHPAVSENERKRIDLLRRNPLPVDVHVVERDDFPEDATGLSGTPPVIFARGDLAALRQPRIGIVGTRSASAYGRACAQKFSEAFVNAGVTVVSGGALGIDAAAHKGALANAGRTVAVLAGGVDHVYPAVHGELFKSIQERGLLVSQFAVGARPNEYKFLVRNSLIAALSQAIVVIEAPYKSGAIRTALDAIEYGKEVFVVPAGIEMLSFGGSFNLIRDGATLVSHPDQILDSLEIKIGQPTLTFEEPVSDLGGRILKLLTTKPIATEFIVQQVGVPAPDVLSELTMLEIEGRVIADSAGYALRP